MSKTNMSKELIIVPESLLVGTIVAYMNYSSDYESRYSDIDETCNRILKKLKKISPSLKEKIDSFITCTNEH